jgi:hypothetical protein
MATEDDLTMPTVASTRPMGFAEAVAAAGRQLVTVDTRSDGAFISMPFTYPSGAQVTVRIEPSSKTSFFVSDYGFGYSECDMMGATTLFRRVAHSVAETAGVKFDHNTFFVAEVDDGQLAGACAAIGSCSLEAVTLSAFKLAEKRTVDDAIVLYDRLVKIFTSARVAKDLQVTGASQTPWHFASGVRTDGAANQMTLFEPVTKHHASIATAVTKFHDIARLDQPPRCVAVVRKKAEFGTYLGVLSQAADVINRDVPDATFARLAA